MTLRVGLKYQESISAHDVEYLSSESVFAQIIFAHLIHALNKLHQMLVTVTSQINSGLLGKLVI